MLRAWAYLLGLLARGEVKPRVAQLLGLDEVAAAHTKLERAGLDGKRGLLPSG